MVLKVGYIPTNSEVAQGCQGEQDVVLRAVSPVGQPEIHMVTVRAEDTIH